MKKALLISAAAASFAIAAPAQAAITFVPASTDQGTLVHANGGLEDVGLEVTADLGSGPGQITNFVHFTGDTTATGSPNPLHIQNGSGQADVTGAEITNNVFEGLISGDIFLTGNAAFKYIEFALTGTLPNGTVDFILTDGNGNVLTPFLDKAMGSGNTHFAFNADGLSSITNVHYSADATPGSFSILKQVRISLTPVAVPEPATWAMMLVGFGFLGGAMRRRKDTTVHGRIRFA